MVDGRAAAARLRRRAGIPDDCPADLRRLLPRLHPVGCLEMPALSVAQVRAWLGRRSAACTGAIADIPDRPLRGAVVASRGCGLIFLDAGDPEEELRFTYAHEGYHYLGNHLFPREDAVERVGPAIQAVLNGDRLPTPEEEVRTALRGLCLAGHVHLLERGTDPPAEALAAELEADLFAAELLAPSALLARRFPDACDCPEDLERLTIHLEHCLGLPSDQARVAALRFLHQHATVGPLGVRILRGCST